MDFQKLLLEAGQALHQHEVKSLVFLCTDLLGRNPASVELATELFSRLVDQDHLSAERPHLLSELLCIIKRTRLARDLRLDTPTTSSLISPYRKLLYNLSEELTDADLKSVKFLLIGKLPRRKLEDNATTLEVFMELEHMDQISETNLGLLESIIKSVCPILMENIQRFKAQHSPNGPIAQETSPPRCKTQQTQASHPYDRTVFCELTDIQPMDASSPNSSITSMDHPLLSAGKDEREALSQELRGLSTETKVGSDDLVMYSQEDETSPAKQTTMTTTTQTVLKTYPMTAAKRGICLIINNYDFTHSERSLQKREGTMIDEESLTRVFDWLGFEVETQRDCSSEKMLSLLQQLGGRDHKEYDCLVCCVLSHGLEGCVYGVDGHQVNIRDLMEPVSGIECSSLAEKPKLFFIQACQGLKEQKAVYIEADGPARSRVLSDAIEVKDSIPSDADFLLGMATVPSFVSFRERKNGTWYIQSLCQNIVQMVPRGFDLVSILTKVNADVSQKTDSSGIKKQMPQPAFSLTKKLVFPIPAAPPPVL